MEKSIGLSFSRSYQEKLGLALATGITFKSGAIGCLPPDLLKQLLAMCFPQELVVYVSGADGTMGVGYAHSPISTLERATQMLITGIMKGELRDTDPMPKVKFDCALCEKVVCRSCCAVEFCPIHVTGEGHFSREVESFGDWGGCHDYYLQCYSCSYSRMTECQHCFKCCARCHQIQFLPHVIETIQADMRDLTRFNRVELVKHVRMIRRILSVGNPPINEVIRANAVPVLRKLLELHEDPDIQLDALWALCNIASGTSKQTQVVVDSGGLEWCILLLDSTSSAVREQATWTIGNIAADCTFRNQCFALGVVEHLLRGISQCTNYEILSWAITNLCRGDPPNPQAYKLLPFLVDYLLESSATNVLRNTCLAIQYLSSDRAEAIVENGAIPKLINLLSKSSESIVGPVLRALGNIACGRIEHKRSLLDAGVLQELERLLHVQFSNQETMRDTCWTIANLAKDSASHAEAVFCRPILLKTLLDLWQQAPLLVAEKVNLFFTNAASVADSQQIIAWQMTYPSILSGGVCFLKRMQQANMQVDPGFLMKLLNLAATMEQSVEATWLGYIKAGGLTQVVKRMLKTDSPLLVQQARYIQDYIDWSCVEVPVECLDKYLLDNLPDDDDEEEEEGDWYYG